MPINMPRHISGQMTNPLGPVLPRLPAESAPVAPRQELPGGGQDLPETAGPQASGRATMKHAVDQINDYVQSLKRDLLFSVDQASGKSVVRVVDSQTGETIRQIPSEEILAISRALSSDMGPAAGVILRDQV